MKLKRRGLHNGPENSPSPECLRRYYEQESRTEIDKRISSAMMGEVSTPLDYYHRLRYLVTSGLIHRFQLVPPAKGVVIDIGVGQGLLLLAASENNKSHLVGIDISLFRLKNLHSSRVDELGQHGAIQSILADAQRLPLKNRVADLTLCCEVLEHVPYPSRVLIEIDRVSKGGAVVSVPNRLRKMILERLGIAAEDTDPFSEPGKGHIHEGWTLNELRSEHLAAGLRPERIVGVCLLSFSTYLAGLRPPMGCGDLGASLAL